MALKSELMASGMSWELARMLGFDPPANFTPATGGQSGATLLTANHAIVTPTAGSQGVIIGDAQQMWFIQNVASGAQSISVFPPSGNSFSGLGNNTGITVPSGKALFIEPGGTTGITWSVSA